MRKAISKSNEFSRLPITLEEGALEKEHKIGWVKERQLQKNENIFGCILAMVRKTRLLYSSLFYYSLQAGCMKKRDRIRKWGLKRESHQKSRNLFACFPAVLSQQGLSTEVMFLLPCAAVIKYLPIQRTYSQTDLDKEFVLFGSKHFGWNDCSCWAKI